MGLIVPSNGGRLMSRLVASLSLALCMLATGNLAYGQTISSALLPNAKTQFFDAQGNPLIGGKVYTYVPNTTSPKTTWIDPYQNTPNADPITLDSGGFAYIFGQGNYTESVYDQNNNLIWSGFTSAYGSAQPSGATGTDTAPIGTVMPFSGFAVPTNWLLAYGQPVSRATYAQLLAAITIQTTTAVCNSGSPTVGGFTSTSQMAIGEAIEASCLPSNSTITSITNSTTIVASANATASTTTTATVFPWGNGDGVSTFNLPDLRGRTFAGADAMGGSAASRLTSSFFGTSAASPGQAGGSQSTALSATNQLPQFTPSGAVAIAGTVSTPTITTYQLGMGSGSGITFAATAYTSTATTSVAVSSGLNIATSSQPTWTQGATTFSGAAIGSGSPSAFRTIQPTLTVNYIIKVLPNSTGAGGVVSWGGMTGDIVCGQGFTCGTFSGINTGECTTATTIIFGCSTLPFTSVNAQTGATYTFQTSDNNNLVTFNYGGGTVAASLPQATGSFAQYDTFISVTGVDPVLVTPMTSLINGATNFLVSPGQTAWIIAKSGNYVGIIYGSGNGSGNVTACNSPVPIAGQIAIWQSATVACGVTALNTTLIDEINQGSYSIQSGMLGTLVSNQEGVTNPATITMPLPVAPFGAGFNVLFCNHGSAGFIQNFTPTSPATFNNLTSVQLAPGDCIFPVSDGTEYWGWSSPGSLTGKLFGGLISSLTSLWFHTSSPSNSNYLLLDDAGAALILNAGSQFSNNLQLAAGNTTEINITTSNITLSEPLKFAASSTGASTQTFTNSPCSGLTTARWISVQITGQTGTWFVPACQ